MNKAKFFRKISNIEELEGYTNSKEFSGDESKLSIIKTVEMTKDEYLEFTQNLLKDRDFIIETTKDSGWFEEDGEPVLNCIFVKEQGEENGILVYSSGFDYPRYTAIYEGIKNFTIS